MKLRLFIVMMISHSSYIFLVNLLGLKVVRLVSVHYYSVCVAIVGLQVMH